MPTLGGITAWISIGEHKLPEYGVQVEDDHVKCYLEVPHTPPAPAHPHTTSNESDHPSPSRGTTPLGTPRGQHAPLGSAAVSTMEYTINWKIQDLTYTMAVLLDIDGQIQIEKIHLGKGTITAANHNQSIDAVAVTDDWSKRRPLTFVKLQPSETSPPPQEKVGNIQLSFYRAGRASLSSGFKSSATGFHREKLPDWKNLIRETSVDGLYTRSHATGLGPITFGPPKKVWTTDARDKHPYVTFEFLYRSRELITEALPDEGWDLNVPSPDGRFNIDKELPSLGIGYTPPPTEGRYRFGRRKEREYRPPPVTGMSTTSTGGANLMKRPSIRDRAKQWASEVKTTATSVGAPLRRTRTRDGQSPRVEVVSTPMEAIKNPFGPHDPDHLPQPPDPSAQPSPLEPDPAHGIEIPPPNRSQAEFGYAGPGESVPPTPVAGTGHGHSHGHGHTAPPTATTAGTANTADQSVVDLPSPSETEREREREYEPESPKSRSTSPRLRHARHGSMNRKPAPPIPVE